MAFENLSVDMQNILLEEHYLFSKKILIFTLLGLSLFYLLYWKNQKEKPTPLILLGIFRFVGTGVAYAILAMSPLFLLFFDPRASFMTIFDTFFSIYGVCLVLLLIILVGNFYFFAPQVLMRMMGMDMKNPRVQEIYTKYFNRKGKYNDGFR